MEVKKKTCGTESVICFCFFQRFLVEDDVVIRSCWTRDGTMSASRSPFCTQVFPFILYANISFDYD